MIKFDGLTKGHVVQLNPETVSNKQFAGCFMTVDEPKAFGAQGYIKIPGESGLAYYRAKWDEMEYIGRAVWDVD